MSNKIFPGATASAEGMIYKGANFAPIVEQCNGCTRVQDFEGKNYCSSYALPATKWGLGPCNFATHLKTETKASSKVNPLKASKRASKGK